MTADTFDRTRVTWVLDRPDLNHLLEALATATENVFDLETTGLDEHAVTGGTSNGGVAARVVLAAFTLPQPDDDGEPTTWLLPLSHPDSPFLGRWETTLRKVVTEMQASGTPLVGHNVKFDCRWLHAHTGIDVSHLVGWDSQVAAHLLDETRSTKLKERAPATFGVERWDDFDLTYPGAAEDVPLFDLGAYAARDTYWTWRLAQHQRLELHPEEVETADEVEAARLGRVADLCSVPTVRTLTAIEQRGMGLDTQWVRDELRSHEKGCRELAAVLATRYPGMDPERASFAPTSIWFREWAEHAVDTGDLRVAALTPNGKPQWSKSVLVRQARGGSEVAEMLLAYRDHSKKAEFLTSWLGMTTPDQRIHSTYNVGSVVSGRLSSSSPNMQQVTKALRPAFVPPPDHVIVELDYSQIELRVAAFIARCEPMIKAFQRGDDLHTLLAARITGKAPSEVLPGERQAGKSANFGLLYGMGAYGFREYAETVYGVSFTEDEAVAIYRAFFDTWEGIEAWHHRAVARAHQTGQVVSPLGRIRRLPGIWDANERLANHAERAAINSPVQGFASDLMQMAAASIEGVLPGTSPVAGARLVGTVHDSIVAEAPADDWERVARECQQRMVEVGDHLSRFDCEMDVPLLAEASCGTRWGLSDVGII